MNYQHSISASGRWFQLSFAEQFANIGGEIERYNLAQKRQDNQAAQLAFYRSLDLINLSRQDPKHKHRNKEIGRFKELWCDTALNLGIYNTPIKFFQDYCMLFALVTRRNR